MNRAETRSLQKKISGSVLWDRDILRFYSVDASSYQIIPEVIVVPKNEQDVVSVVKFAKKHKKSVTVRGAGTGLVGNSLNDGIIVDMKNFDSIKIGKGHVVVGPGTKKGTLDERLERHGKFFPPNPSIGRYCSIGGMLGNNASGSKSLKYGSTIDNVLEVRFVDGNGRLVTLPRDSKIGKKVSALAEKTDTDRIPNVTKNSSGYRIDCVESVDESQKAIVGSEGTLGIIVSAKLKIADIPEKRVLYIIEYDSLRDAAVDCPEILYTEPSAVELVDEKTLRGFKLGFEKNTRCLLFVEYDDKLEGTRHRIRQAATGSIKRVTSEDKIRHWWRLRDMSLHYSLKSIRQEDRIPHIVEDAVVPVKNLADLLDLVDALNRKFGTDAITYGHAGNGNIHVRLLADRRKPGNVKKMAEYYLKRVIELGGSISGEHGDGLARTEFVKAQYGQKNHMLFKQLKDMFDPHNILNPGKKISQKSTMIKNLESMT